MSFFAAAGVVTPDEFEMVQNVYSDIASQDWFTRSDERREQFAVLVLDLFRQGVIEREALLAQCRSIAEESFGNGGLL